MISVSSMSSANPITVWRCDGCFQALADCLQDGLIVVREGRIAFANQAMLRLLGCGMADVADAPVARFVVDADAQDVADLCGRPIDGEALARERILHLHSSHGRGPLTVRAGIDRLVSLDDGPALVVSIKDLTRQEQTEQALRQAERTYRSLFENAVDGIYQTSADGRYLSVNPALARIYGYESPDELIRELTDIAGQLYVDARQRECFKTAFGESDIVRNFEAEIFRRDGSTLWISETARCVRDEAGSVLCYEGSVRDITARKKRIEELRLYAKVFESVAEAIIIADASGTVQAVNHAFETMTGWPAAAVVGTRFQPIAEEALEPALLGEIDRVVGAGGRWQGEALCRHKTGGDFPAWLSITGVRQDDESAPTVITLCTDITQLKVTEAKVQFQASHDAVTGLVNRKFLTDSLDEALTQAGDDGSHVILLILGLDRFKSVNDSLGHAAGDQLLAQVGRRLRSSVGPGDTVGRVGGDEFAVVITGAPSREASTATLEKVLYAFSEPFDIAGRQLFGSPSIGIAVFPEDGTRAEELLSNADTAMYYVKKEGGQPYRFFHRNMSRQAIERLTLEQDLRHALQRNEFLLHYQPKLDLLSWRIVGAEALIRWQHPDSGLVSPGIFIPLAEEAGLINQIGLWTLEEACAQLCRWRVQGLDLPSISVNLSAVQFHDPNLVPAVGSVLKRYGLTPDSLDLEITESMVATDAKQAIAKLNELKAMGISLSIDDFGTGYSSLSYLKNFPINCLKIDQGFVRELTINLKDEAIVSSIIALAKNLGFEVIAEGVETLEQANLLRLRGCRLIQGYFFSRALDAEAFGDMLRLHAE